MTKGAVGAPLMQAAVHMMMHMQSGRTLRLALKVVRPWLLLCKPIGNWPAQQRLAMMHV